MSIWIGRQLSVTETAEQTKAGVRYKAPKNGKGRTVALPAVVVSELRAHRSAASAGSIATRRAAVR